MFRRYNRWHSRFDQPDPYDGSYNFVDPQSLNRYSYVQNDPVNFVDPSGLCMIFWVRSGDGPVVSVSVGCEVTVIGIGEGGGGGGLSDRAPLPFEGIGGGGGGGLTPQSTGQQGPQKDPCPPKIRKFFDTALPYFRGMARALETDPAFLAALSAKETAWGTSPAFRNKHNLFGVSLRERPVRYRSYEASARAWLRMYYLDVPGAPTMEDFTEALKSVGRWQRPYNSVDKGDPRTGRKGYYESLMDYYQDVEAWAKICGITL